MEQQLKTVFDKLEIGKPNYESTNQTLLLW